MAKAAPSRGSVPEPGSSSKTNDSSVDDSKCVLIVECVPQTWTIHYHQVVMFANA